MAKIRKGGKGLIGSKVRAKKGKYWHERKKSPKKYSKYRTIIRGGKKLRIGYNSKTKKWELQSVLTPIKKGKK